MKVNILFAVITLVTITCCQGQQKFEATRIQAHIKILADDSFQGRGTGTTGEKSASAYISSQFSKLKLAPKGDNSTYFQAFPFRAGAHGEGEAGIAANVIGFLDNQSPLTVVIGAHYDHLGMDGQGSSLDANPKEKIHNGADDNASGVAGVLELAHYFANNKKKEKTNFLFVCFSGEELGLLGSKFLTEHLPVEQSAISYMINMDMIGRLDPQTKNLQVNGTGTSPAWEPLLKKLASADLNIKTDSSGVGPSDHTSFYLKDIPVLHFFTGSHSDYHKPSDDSEKINAEGEAKVLELIRQVVEHLDSREKLPFLKTKTKAMAGRSSFKVTMGIMPSYAGDADGLKVDGVSDGKPAAKAGIQTGDVITQIGDYKVGDIEQYMTALGKFEKGQTVPVKVKRGTEELTLTLTF